ncbi:MAG: hypothetical protein COY66_01255 [Candidatus Kerfeldbacteria bacterium CG_4_10_14_0_8_um_filter_42_10]|uniref:Uncharacterized protein n=1 Tax=Candidatus Kerfeldbacteria bacterium CG_4_10_14_0_8_um_filter_42_10 TaxID=2014248 RepID=A0A2M7RK11_9BACT|nr:MAG: hypothetical protein COY66_01255 [Candidatus Kerfeldbacteria bacterium CG_4_10_14_0_8_um_filter_42_10]
MDKKDLKQIRIEIAEVIEDNINPHFEDIQKDVQEIKTNMVTKSYLDDKLAELEGGMVAKLRKEDRKVNRLVEILQKKSLLTKEDVKQLEELKVFPKISQGQS